MKVTYHQSGGFAGLTKACQLDSEQMPEAEATTLQALVEQSNLTEKLSSHSPKARDVHRYDVTIDSDGQTRRLSVDDHTLSENIRPLIRFLQRYATIQPRKE